MSFKPQAYSQNAHVSKKGLVSQLGHFEKLWIVIVTKTWAIKKLLKRLKT
jgi:hypothetical protein